MSGEEEDRTLPAVLTSTNEPQSESLKDVNRVLRVLTRDGKESGSPQRIELARAMSQAGDAAIEKADRFAKIGEKNSNAPRKTSAEECQRVYQKLKNEHPAWGYHALTDAAGKEIGVCGKTVRGYVTNPRPRGKKL